MKATILTKIQISNSEGDSGDNNPGNQEGSDKPGEEGSNLSAIEGGDKNE